MEPGAARNYFPRPASIGPGGIEIPVQHFDKLRGKWLQSDQVELKSMERVSFEALLDSFNRTRWN